MAKSTTSQRAGSRKKRSARFSNYRRLAGAEEAQKRRKGGVTVNPLVVKPAPYCEQVTGSYCEVCGEYASQVTFGIDEIDAIQRLRSSFPGGKAPEGQLYITRGPLLWAMHVLKTEAFFERHAPHCELASEYESEGVDRVPIPPPVIWAESFGDPKQKRVAAAFMNGYNELEEKLLPFELVDPATYTKTMNKNLDILINLRPKKDRQVIKADLKEWKTTFFVSESDDLEGSDFPF
tara:strand:- start:6484 stop:7188 length:705 start_codon:yes stop_codon:yes gene_type:complete